MKAILMSIKARHNRNIESGLKISELRTLPPNLSTPFKVFTYESGLDGRHKVINEWICDNITTWRICMGIPAHLPKAACISAGEIYEYSKHGLKDVSEMHISNLKIYDKPKEINEFKKAGFMTEKEWLFNLYPNTHCHYDAWAKKFNIKSPPQSFIYVEDTF